MDRLSRLANLTMVAVLAGVPVAVLSTGLMESSTAQTAQPRKAEAERIFLQGVKLYQSKRYREAITAFDSALTLYRQIKDRKGEAASLLALGKQYETLRQYPKAIDYYQQSSIIQREVRDQQGEATSLNNLGAVHITLGQFQEALTYLEQALAIRRQIRDRQGEAMLIGALGNIYYNLGQYQQAIALNQALTLFKQIGNRHGEVTALTNLGTVYNSVGQYQQAIDSYQASLALLNQPRDPHSEATLFNNLGLAYNNLGNYQEAIRYLEQAQQIQQQINDPNIETISLNNLGCVYDNLGEYQKAIDLYQRSLALAKQLGNRNGEATALNNLGTAYRNLGQYHKSIEFHQRALDILQQLGNQGFTAKALNNLGLSYNLLGQHDKAIDFYQRSLAIKEQVGDLNGAAVSLNNLGEVYGNQKQYVKAIAYYQKSLTITRQIGDRKLEATTLNNLGIWSQRLGISQNAIDFFQESLKIAANLGDRDSQAKTLNNLGFAFAQINQPSVAILFYKQSINIRESIRKDIKALRKEEQQSYINSIAYSYRNLADILIQQDRVMEALQIIDLLKVQELEDYLKNIKGSDRSAQGVRLLAPEQSLSNHLSTINLDNSQAINNQLGNQIQQIPRSEINRVPEYLNQIPAGTVLIYPLILSDRLEIILFASNTLPIHRTVPIKQAKLNQIVADFRVGLQDRSFQDYREPSRQLYQLLIKPIESELINTKTTTILYAPDGILRYIPLAALHDGKQWLAEKYRVSNLVAYSLSDFRTQSHIKPNIFAGAFGGSSGEVRFGQTALPATIKEVQGITSLFPNSIGLFGNDFSRTTTEARFKNYNILHFATHAYFSTGTPDNSFIIFGNGDKIRLSELNTWQIPHVDLIVLSACQTGTGKLGSGVEILGFGYQVQKAGAKQAIASLWSVSDSGTQVLMAAFYRELQKDNVSATEALNRAQIALINSKEYRHPFYWSAFFVTGNGL